MTVMNMPGTPPIDLYEPDDALAATLLAALDHAHMPATRVRSLPEAAPGHLLVLGGGASDASYALEANLLVLGTANGGHEALPLPLRLGAFVDVVQRLARRVPLVPVGDCRLYPEARRLDYADGRTVQLTEKEVDILAYLSASASRDDPAPRDQLLAAVWNYREGVSTHTLETHIYRLRQKIEADPESPALLLTGQKAGGESGYYLAE